MLRWTASAAASSSAAAAAAAASSAGCCRTAGAAGRHQRRAGFRSLATTTSAASASATTAGDVLRNHYFERQRLRPYSSSSNADGATRTIRRRTPRRPSPLWTKTSVARRQQYGTVGPTTATTTASFAFPARNAALASIPHPSLLQQPMSTSTNPRSAASDLADNGDASSSASSSAGGSHESVDGGVLLPTDDAGIERMIREYAMHPQTSVSLQALMRTGQGEFLHRTFGEETRQRHAATELVLIQVASFLRKELPTRLAHRIHDLDHIPLLREMQSIKDVRELYKKSFVELVELPTKISTAAQEDHFAQVVESIYERHANAMVQMAKGAFEFRLAMRQRNQETDFELQEETHEFLDRFYICTLLFPPPLFRVSFVVIDNCVRYAGHRSRMSYCSVSYDSYSFLTIFRFHFFIPDVRRPYRDPSPDRPVPGVEAAARHKLHRHYLLSDVSVRDREARHRRRRLHVHAQVRRRPRSHHERPVGHDVPVRPDPLT